MIGTYTFYKNGKQVCQQRNLITTEGKKIILRYLARQIPSWAEVIALGVGSTAAVIGDTTLVFETDQAEVGLRAVDFSTGRVTIKGSLDPLVSGKFYEVGLYPSSSNLQAGAFGTKLLSKFQTDFEPWSGGTKNTTNYRIGASSLQLTASASATTTVTLSEYGADLSGYSNTDQFGLAYFLNDVNTATMTVRLKTDASNYYTYSFSPGTSAGFAIRNFNKSNFTATGTPSWSNILSLEVAVTAGAGGSTTVQFDGLTIIDKDAYDNYAIVSRAVLGSPLTKLAGESMDVEYTVQFDNI